MATLTSALNYALAGLSVSSGQSALVSRNVGSANDENYVRRTAEIRTLPGGAPAIAGFSRSSNSQLLDKLLQSASTSSGKNALLDALDRLSALTGDPESDSSVASALGALQNSLKAYETNPAESSLAASAFETARALVQKLNDSGNELITIRREADAALSDSVGHVNALLSQFKIVNDSIVRGQGTATDLTEALDQRDTILKSLSEEIGIRTVTRPNNDLLIYTEGGSVLFEKTPRLVSMKSSGVLEPGTAGNPVYVDGVRVTGSSATMPITGGRLAALTEVRDGLAPQVEQQLDKMAAALITGFAEQDKSDPPVLPAVAGLFRDPSGGLPSVGTPPAGLAARISVNAMADPDQGGSPGLIRDGGFGGASYVANRNGLDGYQDRISQLIGSFDQAQDFGLSGGIGGKVTVGNLATQSAGWIEARRQAAQTGADAASASRSRANDALLRVTGVNIDDEMASLLDLEKSYQASSKIISIIDAMLSKLLEAVG